MSTTIKNQLREVMRLAWQFVRKNGYTMSEALKCAWTNIKLKAALGKRVVKFYFQKVDGTLREAWGHLIENKLPHTEGSGRKPSDTVFTYYDVEREDWRCFKVANFVKMA